MRTRAPRGRREFSTRTPRDRGAAKIARLVTQLVDTGGAVVCGTDAAGDAQYRFTPAGLAIARPALVEAGVDADDMDAVRRYVGGLFR
jgi:hypothetical protein